MASLRARLSLGLAAFILVTGLGAGGLAFLSAFGEAIELQDSVLLQLGALAAAHRFQDRAPAARDVDAEARVVIDELGSPPNLGEGGSPLAGLAADLPDGLQTVARGRDTWRLLVRTRADGSRVAIGQRTAIRDEIARDSALRTILPLAILIPCLMLLIGVVIRRTLRPVSRLAERLDADGSDRLERLPLRGMPDELRPFIASINRLLDRVGAVVDQQRRFIADAAHELRSPVTALGLQAENLDQADLPAAARDRLAALKNGIRRTAHLLEQLLTLARYDASHAPAAPVSSLDQLVKEVVSDFLPFAATRRVDLGFERCEPVSVRGATSDLSTMVRNVLDNALRHTPKGGRIDISIYRDAALAVLQIEDSGGGIADGDLERIFEPFFRGSRPIGEGTGLGLSIVRRIVESLAGAVMIENIEMPGRCGLRLAISIPVAN